MKRIANILPDHVVVLLKRLGIVLLLMYITRIIFLLFNLAEFQQLSFLDFFVAIWLDIITIGMFFMPYYILFLLPIPFRHTKIYRWFFKLLFHATTALLIGLNLLDVEYFKYTSKRSTYDLFSIVSAGNDVKQLLGTFVKDFWFLILAFILLIALAEFLYRKTDRLRTPVRPFPTKSNLFSFVLFVPILLVFGRGGFSLKPTGIIEATRYTQPENLAFILNTPFTMVKTIDQPGISEVHYMSDEECQALFNPIRSSHPQNILPDSTNVVVILLESFGTEFVGAYNDNEGYTPFLDSLIDQSLSFTYAFSNGRKSIEAVPAVLASMPTMMDNPYISSPYGDNKLNALPSILKKFGYSSAFYHGATNGSMRFDGFSRICGFDQYFGRYEYDNDDHFDQTWGILDEYFNPWTAKKVTELKEPFFATLFTLSSHHPYFIPEHMRDKVKRGPQEICASINYGDYALQEFFREAKKQPWYNNTVFVILADHAPSTTTPEYKTRTHLYRIPIIFYHPGGGIKPERSDKVFQQMDIMPTLLDMLNIKTKYYAFGNSLYDSTDREAIVHIQNIFHYYKDRHMITFTEGKARNLYDFTVQTKEPIDSISFYKNEIVADENRLKAIIQRYNFDLIMNQTTADEKENSLHN